MSTHLVRYEAARLALAQAHDVDEVKDIRDKAEAMAAYARQAKDSELIEYATEIKVRAERRCGELLKATEKNTGARGVGSNQHQVLSHDATAPTLEDMGLTRSESSRYQQLADMPEEHFETAVATAKATAGQVTTAFMLREAKKDKPAKAKAGKPKKTKASKKQREAIEAASVNGVSILCTYIRGVVSTLAAMSRFTDEETQALIDLRTAIGRLPIN
jgi:hypothetical protein